MSDLIDRRAAMEAVRHKICDCIPILWGKQQEIPLEVEMVLVRLPSAEPEKEKPRRVLWTGWKGYRDTRYRCPLCNKPVKNDDVYCHRCGQKLMFPKVDWTPYVEGQKQELIVRWDDE